MNARALNITSACRARREAHAHIHLHGRALSMLDLSACTTRAATLEAVAARADALRSAAASEWIQGFGMRVNAWTDDPRWPTRTELDAMAAGRSCCLMSFDHHSVVASTGAFRAAGIGLYDADPPHGVICRDGANQEANGVLLESAAARAWNAAPQPSLEQWRIFVVNALNDLASHGFEEVHDMLSPNWLGPMLSELDARGGLPLTAWLYAPLSDLEQQCSAGWSCDRVCLAGGKVFADGTLNSRTAWMLEPFADPMPDHPCGTALMDTSSLARAMRQCNDARVGLAIHAIGDGAVRASLDAAQATGSGGFIGPGLIPRVRIEHCEVIDRTDIARFASLGVVASVQPCHLLPDAPVLRRQLPHRLDRVLPLRELIDSGCRPGELLWFGSDVPIVRPHPCDSFDAAILRRAEGAPPSEAIGIDQAIRIEECVAAFGG